MAHNFAKEENIRCKMELPMGMKQEAVTEAYG
jgi:hypothetical protein